VLKWKIIKWAWHVSLMGDRRDAYRGLMRPRDYLKDRGVEGRILVRRILRKCDGGRGMD
jgi:hypothetical protein